MTGSTEEQRFAPPLAEVADVAAMSPAGALASRNSRLGAAIIDVVIALAAFGLIAFLTPFNIFRPDPSQGLLLPMARNTVLGFVVFLIVHGYLLATRGQTVGKMLMKIRIVRSDGTRASFARLVGLRFLLNSFLALIPIVGTIYALVDVLFIFRSERRCIHDLIADTRVVQA